LFHDTASALEATWQGDRKLLEEDELLVQVKRERPSFVEAEIRRGDEGLLLRWSRDSAYRFFPLVEHPELGLALHPFDLAANGVLAMVGRLEVRDWIAAIEYGERLQPLGYLAWAACGKDTSFSPASLIEHAARTTHYSAEEVSMLVLGDTPPDAGDLSRRWRSQLESARAIVAALPAEEAGRCVVDRSGMLVGEPAAGLPDAFLRDELRFHSGAIRGAFPQLVREPVV
jgi:hypothetical protein